MEEVIIAGVTMVEDSYYRINGTKKILCWQDGKWMKPVKDHQKQYGSRLANLDKQPTNIKMVEEVDPRYAFYQ